MTFWINPSSEGFFYFPSQGTSGLFYRQGYALWHSWSAAADPIIIKDGIEIDTIEDLSGDEIESITVLKAKDAIEKYGADGAHGAIEIKGKKKDQP